MNEADMVAAEIAIEPHIATARMAVYQFLLAALDKPSQRQFEWLRSDEFRDMLAQLCESFSVSPPDDELTPDDFAEFESRYLACFEVGLPTPPVPLQASHYNRRQPAPATIHEHVLFYQQFGLRPVHGNSEPADHLSNELAFLIHLDERALRQPEQREQILRARRDFLKRQACQWPARAAELAADNGLPALYVTILSILAQAIDHDRELTSDALAELGLEKRP
jgi:DMSO reductase family type II enzyme chaperone